MAPALLQELVIVAGLGVLVALVLGRLRLPAITGLLIAGIVAGPHGLGLARERSAIESLAEVGVVLLLFSVGLELSLSRLRRILKPLVWGGSIQVGLTMLVVVGLALAMGRSSSAAAIFGFVFALSSTAIVLRLLGERGELDAPHGRFIVGVLIFQDLCVVPMVLAVPHLAGTAEGGLGHLVLALLEAVLAVVVVLLLARVVVPRLLAWVDASRSRELFILSVLTICIGTAWLTSLAGLSLALGAFLGGVAVADTRFRHRAIGDVLPLRDAFVSLFFISLGMLFDPHILVDSTWEVALLFAGFVVLKGVFATLAALAMRFPARVAWLAGAGLAQFGEFGFVLLRMAEADHLLTEHDVNVVMAAGILSMSVTPFLIRWAPHVTAGERLLAPLARLVSPSGIETQPELEHVLRDHAIIIGYGVAGHLVGQALRASGLGYVALELNAETVREAQHHGEPVYYGDATSPEALAHAGIDRARVVAILVNDPSAVPRILEAIRRCETKAHVAVRTHYLANRARLLELGADETIVEEVESGVEMVARALRELGVPRNVNERRIAEAREATLESARPPPVSGRTLGTAPKLARLSVDSVVLEEGSVVAGKTLVELALRSETGALCVAVERGAELLQEHIGELPLEVGDVLHLAGTEPALAQAAVRLGARETSEPAALA